MMFSRSSLGGAFRIPALLAVLFAGGMSQPLRAEEAATAPPPVAAPTMVAREITFKIIPAGSPQGDAVRAALAGAAQQGTPPRTLADVDARSASLTTALRQGGFPLGKVIMTQDDWLAIAKTGRAVFTVFPGQISQIEVQNASRMDTDRLRGVIAHAMCGQDPEEPGAPVCLFESKKFERATQLLQDLPGVAVGGAPQVSPGKGLGGIKTTFVIAQKGTPYSIGASIDDNGVESTGRARATLSLSGNNYFGMGEEYSVAVTKTTKNQWTGSFSGAAPIASDGLRATVGFVRSQYTTNAAGTTLVGIGNTEMLGLSYPFERGLDGNLWGKLDYLHTNNLTDYQDFASKTHSRLDSLRASVIANNGDRASMMRTDQWSVQMSLTGGHQANDDPSDGTKGAGPHRAGRYAKLAVSGFGLLTLSQTGDFFVTGRGSGQYANSNLDGGEMFGVGGAYAVRAYRNDEPSFNDGMMFNAGMYKRFVVAQGHQVQIGSFADYAIGNVNHAPWSGWESSYPVGTTVNNRRRLAGYGLEVGWLTPIGATLTLTAAKPFGFSDDSWVTPGKKPVQYWFILSWNTPQWH